MPQNSFFYERIVPIILVLLATVMVILILLSLGVLLGAINF